MRAAEKPRIPLFLKKVKNHENLASKKRGVGGFVFLPKYYGEMKIFSLGFLERNV
jgi:hypothetical protein